MVSRFAKMDRRSASGKPRAARTLARHGRACPGHPTDRCHFGLVGQEYAPMSGGWVYMVTNRTNGTLYTGVTNDIARRAWEHRMGAADGFTKRYGLKRLVFVEYHEDSRNAIQR